MGRSNFGKTVQEYHEAVKGGSVNTREKEDLNLSAIYRKKPDSPEEDKLSHYKSVFSHVLNPSRSGSDLMRTKSKNSVKFSQQDYNLDAELLDN